MGYPHETRKSHLLEERVRCFGSHVSPYQMRRYFANGCTNAMRSKIELMKNVARMFFGYHELPLGGSRARDACCSGAAEGANGKAKRALERAYEFRNLNAHDMDFYHAHSVLMGRMSPVECSGEPKNFPNPEAIQLHILPKTPDIGL